MNYKRCMYFVEGECEEQLINALKLEPRRLIPGKVKVHNVIQDILPRMVVNKIQPGTNVIFVFDTDVPKTDVLQKNIKYVKKYTSQVKLVCLAEVMNFEDEIVRATDVNKAKELTRSPSNSEFKSDFCKMKTDACRNALERHNLDMRQLWCLDPPAPFAFVTQGVEMVKKL